MAGTLVKQAVSLSASNIWLAGNNGSILYSDDGGVSWSAQSSGVTTHLRDISFVNTRVGWAVGYNDDDGGMVLVTIDGGKYWIRQPTSAMDVNLKAIHMVDILFGWIVGDGGVVARDESGAIGGSSTTISSWFRIAVKPTGFTSGTYGSITNNLNGVFGVGFLKVWVVGDEGLILHSDDKASSWSIQTSGTTENLNGVFFLSQTEGWIVGDNATILYTDDGGTNWSDQSPSLTDSPNINDVYFHDSNIGWAVTVGGKVITTSNGGSSWDDNTSISSVELNAVEFVDRNKGWVAGDVGEVWNTTDGGDSWDGKSLTGVNEIQTITIKNNPAGGTFTLELEGETTSDIPYDATAVELQSALLALSNVNDVAVTKSGALPGDVTYTITFQGVDGTISWDQITADSSNLEPSVNSSITGQIDWDADSSEVKDAIVAAAPFISVGDINVVSLIADPENGQHSWQVEFKGSFAKEDVLQMIPDASLLTGAAVLVEGIQNGAGSSETQRITVDNATDGHYKFKITVREEEYTTDNIQWDTTAEELQTIFMALDPFDDDGDVTVTELDKTAHSQRLRVDITFHKKFGNIPIIEAIYEDTLICNPLILDYVPPPPYDYEPPKCDEIDEDLSCQSGPLFCVPGEGDEPEELDPCCDSSSIPSNINTSTRLRFERDLFDPNSVTTPASGTGKRLTIRDLALIKGLNPSNYTPYLRNFSSQKLTATSYATEINTKMNIILIENGLDTSNGRSRVSRHLSNHREILPSRST